MKASKAKLAVLLTLTSLALSSAAQEVVGPVGPDSDRQRQQVSQETPTSSPLSSTNQTSPKAPERVASYVLGPDDIIIIRAFQAEELSDKQVQIAGDGYLSLPMVGRVKAGGLSIVELEAELSNRLANYVRNPQVSILVAEYRSQPISVIGDVGTPGIIQLKGRKSLVEVIALAGGLKPDAGDTVTITRESSQGKLPIAGAVEGQNGSVTIGKVNLHDVMEGRDPQDNLQILPNDVLMVPKARLLYVVGQVQKPGGYVLNERESLSVLQAVALAGGLTPTASAKKAKILHEQDGQTARLEIPTDVKKILDGQAPDVKLHADDILFIPNNLPKTAGAKAMDTVLNMAGVAIWRIP